MKIASHKINNTQKQVQDMNTQRTRHKIPIDLQQLACITVSLPVIGFLFCITWSFWFNFEVSNIFLINIPFSIMDVFAGR